MNCLHGDISISLLLHSVSVYTQPPPPPMSLIPCQFARPRKLANTRDCHDRDKAGAKS